VARATGKRTVWHSAFSPAGAPEPEAPGTPRARGARMIQLVHFARFAAATTTFAAATLVSACSSGTHVADTGGVTATGGSATTTSSAGSVPCGSGSCSPDEYCFQPWDCLGGSCGTSSCACTCAALPDSCPESSPCSCPISPGNTGFGGYFGSPGEVFDGGAPYLDHQVQCYGS
jgi:hypothetical protein